MALGPLKFYLAANLSFLLHGSKIPLGYKYLVPMGHDANAYPLPHHL
jgi:hypothetical protein